MMESFPKTNNEQEENLIARLDYVYQNYYIEKKDPNVLEYIKNSFMDYLKECKEKGSPVNYQILIQLMTVFGFGEMLYFANNVDKFKEKLKLTEASILDTFINPLNNLNFFKANNQSWEDKGDMYQLKINNNDDFTLEIHFNPEEVLIKFGGDDYSYSEDENYMRYYELGQSVEYYKEKAYELIDMLYDDYVNIYYRNNYLTYDIGGFGDGNPLPFFNWDKFEDKYDLKALPKNKEWQAIGFDFDNLHIKIALGKTWRTGEPKNYWFEIDDFINCEFSMPDNINDFFKSNFGSDNEYIQLFFFLNIGKIVSSMIESFLLEIINGDKKEYKLYTDI